jgi:hypothetical protein
MNDSASCSVHSFRDGIESAPPRDFGGLEGSHILSGRREGRRCRPVGLAEWRGERCTDGRRDIFTRSKGENLLLTGEAGEAGRSRRRPQGWFCASCPLERRVPHRDSTKSSLYAPRETVTAGADEEETDDEEDDVHLTLP